MTSIGSIASQAVTSASTDNTNLIQNYETFLTVLTTQLQHQDPMDPMDSSQFTQQLVQFSSVEQQIKSNEQLENLASMMTSSNALGVLNFVGTTVKVDGAQGHLNSYGSTTYTFTADNAGTADITIRNANGEVVYTRSGVSIEEGEQTFNWSGTDNSGNRLPNGTYTINFDAMNDEGVAEINFDTDMVGVVTDVDLSSAVPMLIVNGQSIQTSQIKSVGIEASS
ncbi:flagellar hook capping FlgD N-terminal domain-containing protein [uncultured Cohaesibacter sp.]|uniref:flagellar hook assembly protein FlgD n=1 Tax=uncultured Cohaesibacter sp. TaxID=1002546 RepID=UPI0029C604B9|nr:flagellar hook capping FlgD N-terminal domain-containing protein [uncultured Cohaesibacter sp.]